MLAYQWHESRIKRKGYGLNNAGSLEFPSFTERRKEWTQES